MKILRAVVWATMLIFCVGFAQAESWKFIVLGDDGANAEILGELSAAMVAENPKFVLFSGGLVAEPKTDDEMETQLRSWMQTMAPVYKAGIKVYGVGGSHEVQVPHPDAVWKKVFSGANALPGDGLNYTVSYKNAFIVGIDELNQGWLDQVLRKKSRSQHLFVFSHKMAFRSGPHADGLELDPAARDRFVKSIVAAGGRAGFFGWDNVYDHRSVNLPGAAPEEAFHQFVIGTAGAPFVHGPDDLGNSTIWAIDRISHIEDRYGYAVVEVDGDNATITFKARTTPGVYEPADTFSYKLND